MSRDLHLTSPHMGGDDVLAVQQRLLALGYRPGECDGVFGPATAGAVAAFQRTQGLRGDGWVGEVTRGALQSSEARPAQRRVVYRVQTDGTTVEEAAPGERALAEAVRHVGAADGRQFGEWFGVDGVPWSSIFVSYCFGVGAHHTLGRDYKGAGSYLNGFTYAPALEAWLHGAGLWFGAAEPQSGDIAVIAGADGSAERAGIVEAVAADGSFTVIQGDAPGVQRTQHTLADVRGFGRIEE